MGVILQGPRAVGKTETVRGLGVILSYFISFVHCDMKMSATSLGKALLAMSVTIYSAVQSRRDWLITGKLMQGVPLEGYWLCFDEAHLMNREAVSVLMECTISMFNAIKTSLETVTIHGTEVSLLAHISLLRYPWQSY
mgnify:CR=1 FL=1